MWLTRLALKYPITTFLIALTIAILGIISLTQLPIDLLPNITIPVISVITFYSGASPLDMEQTVTVFVERAVGSVNNVDYIQSRTKEGISQVLIDFNWNANLNVALVDVIQRVNRILNQLPTGVSQPVVLRFDITSLPVCLIAVSGDMDQRDMYDLAYNVIEPQIEHLEGVASAQVLGGRIREIHVILDRNRMQALNMPVQTVINAVASANLITSSGDLRTGPYDFILKTDSQVNMVEPIGNIVIRLNNGVPVYIKDVARVEDSYQEQTEIVLINQNPGLMLQVQKMAGANTVKVVDNVMKALPQLNGIPPGIKTSITFNQALYISQTITGLQHEILIGALLAMIIILAFLRNLRGTIIIIVAIPMSILITFILFRFSNITLNIMTLGGFALAVGRLVDDSIVELEAISRHYNERLEGQTRVQATLAAAKEVAAPIFISTLATVIVFLPIVFLTGIAKLLFIPLTITIAVALFGSFFVSRTITPLMCLHFLPAEKAMDRQSRKLGDRLRVFARGALDGLDNWYEKQLRWVLHHRRLVITVIVIVAVLSIGLVKLIGTEFFPNQDESQFNVTVKLPVGMRSEETEKVVQEISDILKKDIPEINTLISDIGVPSARSGRLFSRNAGSYAANIQVSLVAPDKRVRSVFQIVDDIRPKLQAVPGAQIFLSPSGFLRFLLNFGSGAPIDVQILGYDLDTGSKLANEVASMVRSVPGATDVQISRDNNLPELDVKIDRVKAGILGVDVAEIANAVSTYINGYVASLFTDPVNGNQYNILVRLSDEYRSQIDDLEKLTFTTSTGQEVLLGDLATIEKTSGPVEIDRKYQQRIVDVTADVSGRSLGSVAADIQKKLNTIAVPAGFEITLGGSITQQRQTFRSLLLASLLAIMLVYVVMSAQFQSLIDPFIIMFTVPLGIIGVIWILFLTNTTLSVTSFQGIIVMAGIVVSNGVLLVDYTNHLRLRGLELHDAVVKAGRTRLKPILMTSLSTVLGLLPMAIGLGGEKTQAPLALSVIGGLTVSTFLTLLFVPALYTIFEEKFRRKMRAENELAGPQTNP